MINHLFGKCTYVSNRYIIIDNENFGYKVFTICKENYELNKNYKIFIHKINRLDQKNNLIEELYGFINPMQRNLFCDLLSISGIGVITATNIIANNNYDTIIDLIKNNDINSLSKLHGINQKNAILITTELNPKFSKNYVTNQTKSNINTETNNDLIFALKQLGYKLNDINLAIAHCDKNLPLNEMINNSIKIIAKNRTNA